MTTIKQIAELSGLSLSTVSIVLRGIAKERSIPEITCKRVWDAANALQYKPNIAARSLRDQDRQETTTIAMYWAKDFRASMMIRFLDGLNVELTTIEESVKLIIVPYTPGELHKDNRLNSQSFYHAAIICNASDSDMEFLHKEKLALPIVLYNRTSKIYDNIYASDEEIGTIPAKIFINHGKKHPALLKTPKAFAGMKRRCDCFLSTLKEHNIASSYVVSVPNEFKGGYKGACSLFKNKKRPDCLFCASDVVAIGAMHYLHENNIAIPEDVEIISVGNGDPHLDNYIWPSLSSVNMPMEQMAKKCLRLLLTRLNNPLLPLQSFKATLKYIERKSCAK